MSANAETRRLNTPPQEASSPTLSRREFLKSQAPYFIAAGAVLSTLGLADLAREQKKTRTAERKIASLPLTPTTIYRNDELIQQKENAHGNINVAKIVTGVGLASFMGGLEQQRAAQEDRQREAFSQPPAPPQDVFIAENEQ